MTKLQLHIELTLKLFVSPNKPTFAFFEASQNNCSHPITTQPGTFFKKKKTRWKQIGKIVLI